MSAPDRPPTPAGPARPGRVHEISAPGNPIIKDIRRLVTHKRAREDADAFVCEGLKLARDAAEGGWELRTLIVTKAARERAGVPELSARTVAGGGDVLEVSERAMSAIARRDNPAGVAAVVGRRTVPLAAIRPGEGDVWVALDRVRDPGNLGTVMRTIDAVGARGVILVGECVDPFGLEAVRATMGSLFAVPLARATAEQFLAWRRGWPGRVVGTHLAGATDYRAIDYRAGAQLIVMGNEQRGLPDELAAACDALALIPQQRHGDGRSEGGGSGGADSLNLAVATGVMLYEVRRHALPRHAPASHASASHATAVPGAEGLRE